MGISHPKITRRNLCTCYATWWRSESLSTSKAGHLSPPWVQILYLGLIHWVPLTEVPGQNFVHGSSQLTENLWNLGSWHYLFRFCWLVTLGGLISLKSQSESDKDQTARHSDLGLSFLLPRLGCFNTELIGSKCKRIKSEWLGICPMTLALLDPLECLKSPNELWT